MAAIETIGAYEGTSGASLGTATFAPSNSGTIRSFPSAAEAFLVDVGYDDVTSPELFEVLSPLLHDNTEGIAFDPGAIAPYSLFPSDMPQRLRTQDTLTIKATTAATTGKAAVTLTVYYSQLPGADARLYSPGDISGLVVNVKNLRIAVASGANTAGEWYDLVATTTEDLLKANTDYAVLGAWFDQAVAAVAFYGSDTSNLRIGVPGGVNRPDAARYFVRLSELTGRPCIPVINSANIGSTYGSIFSSAATGADGTIDLVLAQLSQNLS